MHAFSIATADIRLDGVVVELKRFDRRDRLIALDRMHQVPDVVVEAGLAHRPLRLGVDAGVVGRRSWRGASLQASANEREKTLGLVWARQRLVGARQLSADELSVLTRGKY